MTDEHTLQNGEIWQRIGKIRQFYCGGSNIEFAAKIEKDPTYTSQLCNGSKSPGKKILDLILEKFPEVSRVWLYMGDGSMRKRDNDPKPSVENKGIYINHGGGNDTYNNYPDLLQVVIAQQESIRELTEQVKMLTQAIVNKLNQ